MKRAAGARARISVVDDDDDVRKALCATFHSAGYDVSCFPDAEAFLTACGGPGCACLVSDVQMPGIGGLELARRVRAAAPRLPVILVSAYVTDLLRQRAADAGADWLYDKPFDVDDLLARVASLTCG